MRALSIMQPWASLIVRGIQKVENRSWSTAHRGPLLIHAPKKIDYKFVEDYKEYNEGKIAKRLELHGITMVELLQFSRIQNGGVIGAVNLVKVVKERPGDPFFFGEYGFLFSNPMRLPLRRYKGKLKIFEIPDEPWMVAVKSSLKTKGELFK